MLCKIVLVNFNYAYHMVSYASPEAITASPEAIPASPKVYLNLNGFTWISYQASPAFTRPSSRPTKLFHPPIHYPASYEKMGCHQCDKCDKNYDTRKKLTQHQYTYRSSQYHYGWPSSRLTLSLLCKWLSKDIYSKGKTDEVDSQLWAITLTWAQ